MRDLGNRPEDSIIDFTFHTTNTSAVPTALTGVPVPGINIYKANSTTQAATGVTLTTNFDGITGLNHVRIDSSVDSFYATANDYSVVVSTGTVDSISVVGATVATFSIENRFDEVNIVAISGDATSVGNLSKQYNTVGLTGDTFPSTQAQLGNISTGSASISTTASGDILATGTQAAGTYLSTVELNDTYHRITPDTNINIIYGFDIGANASPVSVLWQGYVLTNNDNVEVSAYNWAGAKWEQIDTIPGMIASTRTDRTMNLTTAHVGTTTQAGVVHVKFQSDGADVATNLYTDRLLCSYTLTNQSVGYANGSIWVDSAGTAASVSYVNGTADNPCPWANALTISSALGIKRFTIANGNTVTLSAAADNYSFNGNTWALKLGNQAIGGMEVYNARITQTGTSTGVHPHFNNCAFGAVTLPPSELNSCGIGDNAGTFTANNSGDYVFRDCFSLVPGSASPALNFSGIGGTIGVNNRRWAGGATYTLDTDCTLSHEVVAGGGTTIAANGANVEIRGITRSVNLTCSNTGTIQFVGVTGPISITGTAATTINLYGVSSLVTDNSVGTTVNDQTVNQTNVADSVLSRNVSNVEATAPEHSLCTTVLAPLESAVTGLVWTINRTDGVTPHAVKTITVNAAANPITSVT